MLSKSKMKRVNKDDISVSNRWKLGEEAVERQGGCYISRGRRCKDKLRHLLVACRDLREARLATSPTKRGESCDHFSDVDL